MNADELHSTHLGRCKPPERNVGIFKYQLAFNKDVIATMHVHIYTHCVFICLFIYLKITLMHLHLMQFCETFTLFKKTLKIGQHNLMDIANQKFTHRTHPGSVFGYLKAAGNLVLLL